LTSAAISPTSAWVADPTIIAVDMDNFGCRRPVADMAAHVRGATTGPDAPRMMIDPSKITPPPFGAALLELGISAAGQVKRNDDEQPHPVDARRLHD
jgi:hypothetical protein